MANLRTARLILRPLRPEDAPALTCGIGDWEVMKWLTSPPWPYGLADAEWFLNDPMSAQTFGVESGGELAGAVGLHPHKHSDGIELGYWLARRFHGRGLMTEAARAVVADHFARGGEDLVSGYLAHNVASCNVLTKLGFRPTEVIMRHSNPIGYAVPLQRMALTAEDFRG